jgi:hypothetical protein
MNFPPCPALSTATKKAYPGLEFFSLRRGEIICADHQLGSDAATRHDFREATEKFKLADGAADSSH